MTPHVNMLWMDTETTGLLPRKNAVVSIAALANWNTEGNFYMEVRPFEAAELDDKAMQVNGFTRDQLFDAARPSELDAANAFNAWIQRSFDGPPLVCGQNVRFDMDFVGALYRRTGVYLGLQTRAFDIQTVAVYLHTLGIIELPFKGSHILTNLDVLLKAFLPEQARQSTKTHSAYEDVWLTRNVFWAMQRKVGEMSERLAKIGNLADKLEVLTGDQLAIELGV